MLSYIYGLFSETPAKLGNIGDSGMIEGPKDIFVE